MLTWMIIFIILAVCAGWHRWVKTQVGSAKSRVQKDISTLLIPSLPGQVGRELLPGIPRDRSPSRGWDVPSKSHTALGTQEGRGATSQPRPI